MPYSTAAGEAGKEVVITIGATRVEGFDDKAIATALKTAGYPSKADPATVNKGMLVLLLLIQVIYVTMVYGPIAAWLVGAVSSQPFTAKPQRTQRTQRTSLAFFLFFFALFALRIGMRPIAAKTPLSRCRFSRRHC